jgi:DNA-binding response OmpR family regulator
LRPTWRKTEGRSRIITNIENKTVVNNIKILIVDDDPDMVLTFKTGLESNGFEVDSYNDPLLALKNFKANFYDLLLIDIRMPDMTGFEIYYRALLEEFADLERKCFIQKPISIDELVKRIQKELN